MNESRAEAEGLSFTGIYKSFFKKEEVKDRIKKERKERPNCRIVLVKANCGGYSAYADSKYFAYDTIKHTQIIIDKAPSAREKLKEQYEADLAHIEKSLSGAMERHYAAKVLLGQK